MRDRVNQAVPNAAAFPRALVVVAVASLFLLAGAVGPAAAEERADPDTDTLGWENGYWHDDPIEIEAADGLNETELQAIVARMTARLETIRELEYTRTVDVSIINRSTYVADRGANDSANTSTHERWNNQVWEGLFIVGEREDFSSAANQTYSTAVQGFYSAEEEQIVIVSDSPTPVLNRGTLAHELTHALQDQQLSLTYPNATQDQQLAGMGVIEGEANLLERRYQRNCGAAWSCYEPPSSGGGGGGGGGLNTGVLLVLLNPYVSGPGFVQSAHDDGGWAAVDALYEAFPASSEQVIHPERYPEETPVPVTVENRSTGGWERFDHDPVADTVGEASIYAMLVENGATGPGVSRYGYVAEASVGWGGDTLVPYRRGEADGYVWKTAWDSESDAREFHEAYRAVLETHDASRHSESVWVVPESDPFGDAFRVTREGETVTIVNGPTVRDLAQIHATAEPPSTPTGTSAPAASRTTSVVPATTATATSAPGATATETPGTTTAASGPGFGLAATVLGLLVAVLAARRHS